MIVYTAASIFAWVEFGKPNPNGLGYTSKGIEIVLIVVLVVHAVTVIGQRAPSGRGVHALDGGRHAA